MFREHEHPGMVPIPRFTLGQLGAIVNGQGGWGWSGQVEAYSTFVSLCDVPLISPSIDMNPGALKCAAGSFDVLGPSSSVCAKSTLSPGRLIWGILHSCSSISAVILNKIP